MTSNDWHDAGMDQHLRDLGQKVKRERLNRGWSKEFAAREARISAITWKRVEDGLGVQDAKRAAVVRVLELDHDGEPLDSASAIQPPTQGDPVRDAIANASSLDDRGRRTVLAVYDREASGSAPAAKAVDR